jgi:hypothetical protein
VGSLTCMCIVKKTLEKHATPVYLTPPTVTVTIEQWQLITGRRDERPCAACGHAAVMPGNSPISVGFQKKNSLCALRTLPDCLCGNPNREGAGLPALRGLSPQVWERTPLGCIVKQMTAGVSTTQNTDTLQELSHCSGSPATGNALWFP